jgi:membrane-associated HD superfamily phosphohydrolase
MVDRPFRLFMLSGLCLTIAPHAFAVEATKPSSVQRMADTGTQASAKNPAPVDRDTVLHANKLVSSHLPSLKSVLERLREDQPREYDRAVRDLARSARKLDSAKSRDERLYELELELLQAQTDAALLTAKLKVRDNAADRRRLKNAAARLQQAQISRSEYDIAMYKQRLERTQQLLKAAEEKLAKKQQNREEAVEKSYSAMLRKAGRDSGKSGDSKRSSTPNSSSRRPDSRKTNSERTDKAD